MHVSAPCATCYKSKEIIELSDQYLYSSFFDKCSENCKVAITFGDKDNEIDLLHIPTMFAIVLSLYSCHSYSMRLKNPLFFVIC